MNLDKLVCEGPRNKLLGKLTERSRLLGKYEAAHPATVERVLAALDAVGPSEAGDVIQSLLWELVTTEQLAAQLSEMLAENERSPG